MGELRIITAKERLVESIARAQERWAGRTELQQLAYAIGKVGFQRYQRENLIMDPESRLPISQRTQH